MSPESPPPGAAVYRKHNSFVSLRRRGGDGDPLDRVRRLSAELPGLDLPETVRAVFAQACAELLAPASAGGAEPFRLHPNVEAEMERLADDELPRYLHYRYRYEVYPQRKILDGFPPCLQVEPTSICNYRCVFCYQTDKEFTRGGSGHMGMMTLDTFKRVIDQAQGRCEAVTLASRGEPLLNPLIEGMLAHVSGKFLALKLNTNAWYLDEAKSHALLQAGLNTLVFSADAAQEPEYSRLRVNGSLERVLRNIRLFQGIRAKHYPDSRVITRVSGVKVPGSGDMDAMERFWGEYVDQVAFVQYNPWENAYLQPLNGITIPCSDLWRRMFVWWDGTVNPCDVDYKSTLSVGSVVGGDLRHLWRGENYRSLREIHLDRRRASCSPCGRCAVV